MLFKRIFIIDVIQWVGFALLFTGVSVGVLVTTNNPSLILTICMTALASMAITMSTIILVNEYKKRPNFDYTLYNISFYLKDVLIIKSKLFDFIDLFIEETSNYLKDTVSKEAIEKAIEGLQIHLVSNNLYIRNMSVCGFQIEKLVAVQLKDSLSNSALAHELIHLIQYYCFGLIDGKHEETEHWELVSKINKIAKEKGL